MRGGGGGRIVTQGGGRGGMQGRRGGMQQGARGGMQGARGGMQGNRGGGGGQNTWKGRGGFRGKRGRGGGGGGDRAFNQYPSQPVAMPTPNQVNQTLARQATFSPQQTISVQLPDARDKLNLKARGMDARVRLNKKAHQTDARVKLNAKRKFSGEPVTPPTTQQTQQQGLMTKVSSCYFRLRRQLIKPLYINLMQEECRPITCKMR